MLRVYGDVIEADVQRTYCVDVTDLWRGRLSLRRVRVLLQGLPATSQTALALAGVERTPLTDWSLNDVLLGRLLDELAAYRWQWEHAHMPDKDRRRHRKPPETVLPQVSPAARLPHSNGKDADVIPLVSPHRLGDFVTKEDDPHGN